MEKLAKTQIPILASYSMPLVLVSALVINALLVTFHISEGSLRLVLLAGSFPIALGPRCFSDYVTDPALRFQPRRYELTCGPSMVRAPVSSAVSPLMSVWPWRFWDRRCWRSTRSIRCARRMS